MNQCFKIKRDTDYDKAIKKHFEQRPLWKEVFSKVNDILGETEITEMATVTDALWIDTEQLKNSENVKLFTKDGKLKTTTKKGKEILQKYKEALVEAGVSDFQELRVINFTYGVMRLSGQNLESFVTSENDIYYKGDFDLVERSRGLVVPISEIEYEEKYLEELKKKDGVK